MPDIKYCFVLCCINNSRDNPNKCYFRVPHKKSLRDEWCLAIGRSSTTLSQSSPAYCCSDHFDLEVDLDESPSSSKYPKLREHVRPSIRNKDVLGSNFRIICNILGKNTMEKDISEKDDITNEPLTKNVYIREVVYIEGDQKLLQPPLSMRLLPIENEASTSTNQITQQTDKLPTSKLQTDKLQTNIEPSTVQIDINKAQKSQLNLVATQSTPQNRKSVEKGLTGVFKSRNATKLSINSKLLTLPGPLTQVKYRLAESAAPRISSVTSMVVPFAKPIRRVGKLESLKLNKFNDIQINELPKLSIQADDDDDCILIEEENALKKADDRSELLKTLPSSLSINVLNSSAVTKPQQRLFVNVKRTDSGFTVMPIDPLLGAREFSKASAAPIDQKDKVYELIKLMISENLQISANLRGNTIMIKKTRPNEFQMDNTVYYYRTDDKCEKNYFFMNITRMSSHEHQLIQRSYGIYWGDPRLSCVGVVETKGTLDDEMKNFIFEQVKKNLFNLNDQSNTNLVDTAQTALVVRETLGQTERSTSTKPIASQVNQISELVPQGQTKPSTSTNPFTRQENQISEIINLDDNAESQPIHAKVKGYHRQKKKLFIGINSPGSSSSDTTFPTTTPEAVVQNNTRENSLLIPLLKFLTPSVRNLINKLRYFKMENGCVYAVNVVPPNKSANKPCDIVFTKIITSTELHTVDKQLYLAKLVQNLFQIVHPVNERKESESLSCMMQIPDITSEKVEALIHSQISQLLPSPVTTQASVPKKSSTTQIAPHTSQNKMHKHKCNICFETFERKYHLQRHEFVEHNVDEPNSVAQDQVTQPIVTEPSVTQSIVTRPIVTRPIVTRPIVTRPIVTRPIVTQPIVTQPIATRPIVTRPIATRPIVTQPIATRPIVTRPIVTQPIVTRPIVIRPILTRPIVTQPSVTQPKVNILTDSNEIDLGTPTIKIEMVEDTKGTNLIEKQKLDETNGTHSLTSTPLFKEPNNYDLKCHEEFSMKYKLKEETKPVPSTSSAAFNDFLQDKSIATNLFPSDSEMQLRIKKEPEEETTDKSLLMPLYENPTGADHCVDKYELMLFKQEPEEHIDEVTTFPLPTEETPEETDSASECSRNSKKKISSMGITGPKDRHSKLKIKKTGQRKAIKKKRIGKTPRIVPQVVPVKLSKAKSFMWG